ncbi:cell division protein SepF [Dactylococcopsis salina]|uniref:Cell division protein SepF n=1 Tax=Dactylococcopsis salina (strain PCC 8305) TaxID=13035 RepID=K9YQ08_DACS8|nr:hypothetical protein Dacsa_0154 [Dactylococcopsis salina PCC 8305]
MSNVFNRLRDFVGFNEPEDVEEYYEDEEMEDTNYRPQEVTPPPENERPPRRRLKERTQFTPETRETMPTTSKSNVIGMPGANNGLNEIVVIEPQSFEKMPEVIQALRKRKTVLLNLNMMEPDDAQRAVDFVAGGTFAIDGNQERVGESIFLFTPDCVNVTSHSHSTQGLTAPNPSNVHQMNPNPTNWRNQGDQIPQ